MKGKYLITTDNYFYGPDGQQYRSVFGEIEILQDGFLGITTNRNSSNWYIKVSGKTQHIIIAGCQIHYALKCEYDDLDLEDWILEYNDKGQLKKELNRILKLK